MGDIGPGDVVACVEVRRSPYLRKGAVYRVHDVIVGERGTVECGRPLLRLEGLLIDNGFGRPVAYCPSRFRKIDKGDESFTETVRACRPIRQREPA